MKRIIEDIRILLEEGLEQSSINASVLALFLIQLLPIEEQKEIIKRLQRLLKLTDSLAYKYQNAMFRIEKIEQSILA